LRPVRGKAKDAGLVLVKFPRRKFVKLAAAATAALAAPRLASAADYPTRPVRLFVGYAPGGPTDIVARLLAQRLSERLGQPFIVEDHPGAAGNLATEEAVRSRPDGYTLLLISGSNAYNTALYHDLNFDFIRDIAPVASIGRSWGVLEVHPSFPAASVPEFIAYAGTHPGQISMAAAGIGSGPHLYGALFMRMAGVDLVTVHYGGSGAALPDLIAGRVQTMFDLVVSSIGYIKAGKLRPLGVTSAKRLDVLPDVPPIGDFIPGYETNGWYGLGAPVDTPAAIINALNTEVNAALADAAFTARLAEVGVEPFASSLPEFRKFIVEFTDKWSKIIRDAGITLD
jgi:tripartite-type tricarboxylate transporter receptor subunit TctC